MNICHIIIDILNTHKKDNKIILQVCGTISILCSNNQHNQEMFLLLDTFNILFHIIKLYINNIDIIDECLYTEHTFGTNGEKIFCIKAMLLNVVFFMI